MGFKQFRKYSLILVACLLGAGGWQQLSAQDFISNKTKYVQDTSRFEKADGLFQKGKNAQDKGQGQQAVDFYLASIGEYQRLYKSALESNDYETAINSLLEKADIEKRIYPNETPYNTLKQARDLLDSHIPLENFLWFRTYLTYGRVAHFKADYYRATDYLDSAQLLYGKSAQYDDGAYRNLLEFKFYDYLYSYKSIDTVQKYIGLRLALEREAQANTPVPEKILYILQDYPDIYSQKGEYDIALAYAISNYQYFSQNRKSIKNKDRYGEVYFDLSLALYRKDQLNKALEIAFEYLNSDPSLTNDSFRANTMNLIGLIYNEMDKPKQAIEYFKKFLELPNQSIGDMSIRIAKATALLNMGINLYDIGDTKAAMQNYNRSLQEMKELVEFPSTDLINCYRYLGDFYAVEERWRNALINYDSALRNTELKYSDKILEFPKSDSASRFSLESLTILKKKTKAILNTHKEDPITYLESVLDHVDKTHDRIKSNRESLYKTDGKLFLSQFFKELYETGIEASFELYRITGDAKYSWKAFSYAQLSKSNLFLEQEKDYKEFASSSIPYSLKEVYYNTSARLENLKTSLYKALDNSLTGDSVLRLSDQILRLEERVTHLKDSISLNYSSESSLESGLDAINSLRQNEVLLEYFYGDRNVYAFGVNAQRNIVFMQTENDGELQESLEGFLKIVSSQPNYEEFEADQLGFKKQAYTLYSRLIGPALDQAGKGVKALVIVPDEFLTRIPFEALITSPGEDQNFKDFDYLIKNYNIRYMISSNTQKTSSVPMDGDYKILGFGFSNNTNQNAGSRGGLSSLPGTEREIQFLNASFKGDYYLGEEGTKQEFLTRARDYDILHLAIHGKADSANRFLSRLIFNGSDSILNPNQLYLANIQALLTVLSACESGKGQIESGEGTFSIARGFAIVGVPNIVMSLWEVDDRTTSTQMVNFYENFLNNELDLNSSLRNVKLDYIEKGDSYQSHPYYWASFVHLGQNADFEADSSNPGLMIGLLLLALLVAAFIGRNLYKKRKEIQN